MWEVNSAENMGKVIYLMQKVHLIFFYVLEGFFKIIIHVRSEVKSDLCAAGEVLKPKNKCER